MAITPPPLVMVVWEDALEMDDGAWADGTKPPEYKPQIFNQVGFLLSDTDEGLVLTAAWSPNLVARRDQIPKGMVRQMFLLEPAKSKRRRSG